MVVKMQTFKLLKHILEGIPTDIIYTISKYSGKYTHFPKIDNRVYKTKFRKDKYSTKHLVTYKRSRGWSF